VGFRSWRYEPKGRSSSPPTKTWPRARDVVVNDAGITGFEDGPVSHDPEHGSLEDWRAVRRVNLDGTFLGCRYPIHP
jgi:NAD(P)-dependent dehydrogenase (short-subunit alcohol dehydrogenase family)